MRPAASVWTRIAAVKRVLRIFLLVVGVLAAVVVAGGLMRELAWRHDYPLQKPEAPSPDAAFLAEVRALPDSPLYAPQSSGVFVRPAGRNWLRSSGAALVVIGACDNVDTRWMSARRLVVECELRSGEPRLLQALVGDVVIELVVQPKFALRAAEPIPP